MAERAGARIYIHEATGVSFPHVALRDGDEIPLGNNWVHILHTPGHAPEHVCLLVGDRIDGPDPWFVLTGDTLFVGGVGRPDAVIGAVTFASGLVALGRVRETLPKD